MLFKKRLLKLTDPASLAVSAVIWICVCIVALGATISAYKLAAFMQEKKTLESVNPDIPLIKITRTPLKTDDYKEIKSRLSGLYPEVIIDASAEGLNVKVNDLKNFPVIKEVVKDVLSSKNGVKWDVVKVCAGVKCGIPAYTFFLKGYALDFKV